MKRFTLACACTLACLTLSSTAAATQAGQWYGRAEIGHTDLEVAVGDLSADDTDTAYSLRIGHYFTPHVAMEGFYSILGDRSFGDAAYDMDAAGLGVVGKKNFGADNTGFFLAGRAGVQSVNSKLRSGELQLRERSTKPYFGVGAGYDFDHHNGVSLNYDYNKGDLYNADVTAQTLTLGYEYRF
ncbi:porin family protein [Pseudoxanthomonas sp. Root630]|uniref:porin family protein n=1 Tax=Pseudoxanthomonas sp. Root630 TaxID=1736574 RepID=UPI000A46A994|nr:porin family protein [Pseudoxanthomonas sp. Root630]